MRLYTGLVLFGAGIALMVAADLGLPPWDVLHQGLSERTGISIGVMNILVGFVVLLMWFPLRERVGIGTISNVIVIGLVIDLVLAVVPDVDHVAARFAITTFGLVLVGVGSGFYIGAGLGPGPRDGLMTGIARRGLRIGLVRAAIEISVLAAGWLLGGTVGVGTVMFALFIGPLVEWSLNRLSLRPAPVPAAG